MASFPTVDGVEVFRLPPEGYVVNFDHPQQQKVLDHYLIFAIGGPLAFIALMQRYYTKIFLSKGLQVDDGFMFLGWLSSVLTQALMTASIAEGGMCAHSWDMPLSRYEHYSLLSYIAAPIYMLCNGFTKLSLLSFYLHLSPQKWFRVSVWTSIVIVTIYTIVITFMMFFVCNPPRKAFDFHVVGGSCTDAAILYMATAVSNIVTDVMLFLLPIRMIYKLHMPVVQKVGAIIVFGVGSLTIATSIIRLVKLPVVLASTDPSWDAAPANIWTFVEGNLFVICGSMPTLRKFFKHLMPRIMGGSSATSNYAGSYGANQHSGTLSRVRKQRSQYAQFPEEDGTELQRFSDETKDLTTTVHVAGSPDVQRDDHSDRAILRTQSFTVQYT
ncbi:hypothetical protein G7Z17_g1097 [Cylindrodendrum hubeiense]|uniref:Rhodopsin domain-containing protein n=1 Tax=Cylindrodendrum hubeiense TaxID=595255 RepID=A0A9P5LCS4_9HYPO|nr:hypothetical protein G7Z17_g1097 [Cylindrodendrum hubeiense]